MTWILAVGLLLAFANGANDNLKGVASLLGSRRTSYRRAVAWATVTTLAGSLAALLLAGELIGRFQGKGLVPPELTADPHFLGAVGLAAGATVLLATFIVMPISTTHALVGALVGAGLAAVGSVRTEVLVDKVLAPLMVCPLLALVLTATLYRVLQALRARLRVKEQTCFCLGERAIEIQPVMAAPLASVRRQELSLQFRSQVACPSSYGGRVLRVSAGPTLDSLHFLSGGALGFARGLNDTPKIAALLLVIPAICTGNALVGVGLVMALGGLLAARRVAHTMSFEITPMNAGQAFTANFVSMLLVLVASPLGLPVSTTHVTCGALFGLGLSSGDAQRATMLKILLAWIVTLPLAGLLAFAAFRIRPA